MKQDLYNNDWINIDGNLIHKTAIIHPNVVIGTGNIIGAYCVIGGNGEIRGISQDEFKGIVVIGDNNVISEMVTIQRPATEGKKTIICNNNLIMAHTHIGHDAYIGNGCEICTSTVIGGYASVYNGAKIKIGCLIRNRRIIGVDSVVGMGSVVTKDVVSGAVVYGNPAREKQQENTLVDDVEKLRESFSEFGNQIYKIRKWIFVAWCTIAVGGIIYWIMS